MAKFETEQGLENLINNCGFGENKSAYYMAMYAHRYLQQKFDSFNSALRTTTSIAMTDVTNRLASYPKR